MRGAPNHRRVAGLWARGPTIRLTNASVEKPWQPFDDDDDRGLIEHCCINAAKHPWDLGHPPQQKRARHAGCLWY